MAGFGLRMKLTVPVINENWWQKDKSKMLKLVEKYNKEMWASQQDPVTLTPWSPRKQPTGSWPLLRKTGRMQDTAKFRAGNQPMTFSARVVPYGPFLQYGTSRMVARRWLGLGPQVLQEMGQLIAKSCIGPKKKTYTIP
jgi:phage gpG-like protein